MSWIKLAILLLQLANKIVQWGQEKRLITEGEDREIARQNAEMLKRSQAAKQILAEVSALPDNAVDDLLRGLDESLPKRGDSK